MIGLGFCLFVSFVLYLLCYVSFYLFFFNAKPEGIEKEQTFNTLLCASGMCNKTQNSQAKPFSRIYSCGKTISEIWLTLKKK